MLISNVHKDILVMNSIDTRFSTNVFEAVKKLATRVFMIGSETTWLRLLLLVFQILHNLTQHFLVENCFEQFWSLATYGQVSEANFEIPRLYTTSTAYGKNFVGGAEHNLPEWNLLVTDAQDDSFMTSSFHRHTVRAQVFKIVQIFSVNRDQHF